LRSTEHEVKNFPKKKAAQRRPSDPPTEPTEEASTADMDTSPSFTQYEPSASYALAVTRDDDALSSHKEARPAEPTISTAKNLKRDPTPPPAATTSRAPL